MRLELCSIKMKRERERQKKKKKILRLPTRVISPKCFIKDLIAFWF